MASIADIKALRDTDSVFVSLAISVAGLNMIHLGIVVCGAAA
jgi:hypothetical protein